MRIFIVAFVILIFVLLIPGIVFASCCYEFGNFRANIAGGIKYEFRPFFTGIAPSNLGTFSSNIGFDYKPITPQYTFRSFDLGDFGFKYQFTMPQPTLSHFHVPEFDYYAPMREIPRAQIGFGYTYIPLRNMDLYWDP